MTDIALRDAGIEERKEDSIGIGKFIFIYALAACVCLFISSPRSGWFNWYLSIFWSLYFPVAVLGFSRALAGRKIDRSSFSGMTDKLVVFVIPTVCRKDTLPGLIRVLRSILKCAPRNLKNYRIDIVTEQGAEALGGLLKEIGYDYRIRLTIVPKFYETPNKTLYKARASHYATERRKNTKENTGDVYIYHLDDDTHVEEDTIASIAEFIEKYHGEKLLAQGILTFPYHLSPSRFCRRADAIRPLDDLTRFKVFTGDLGTPLAGLHGEHLLIRADIEDEIGWDFGDTLAEDAYFGLMFAQKYPGKATQLNSYSYGASPANIKDFIKQRKRWAAGILGAAFDRKFRLKTRLPLMYSVSCWIMGPFQFVIVVLALAWILGVNNTSPVALWVIFLWAFNVSYHMWQYIEGNRINISVSKTKKRHRKGKNPKKYKNLSLVMMPLVYAFTFVEGVAAFQGFIKFLKKDYRFEVIGKEV